MKAAVDYTHCFQSAVLAQGSESHVLILSKLDRPCKRGDGKMASYELEYRWLSCECKHERDEAYACAQGSDLTFWQAQEIPKLLYQIKHHRDADLFQHFNLF